MSVTSGVVNKFLKTLRESNSIAEKWTALTCITSHAGKGLAQALTRAQFTELCTQLISLITSCDPKSHIDVTKLCNIIFKEFTRSEPIIFELALNIDRSKRLAFLDFLTAVDLTVLAHLLTDENAIKFLESCLEGINVESMKWLGKDPTPANIEVLRKIETRQLDDEEEVEHTLITRVMQFLQRVYTQASGTPNFNISQFHILILEKITILAYMGYSKQREQALKLLELAVCQGLVTYIREKHPTAWTAFKANLAEVFSPRMMLLVTYKYSIWSSLWSLTIKMLGTEAHKNSALINELLLVEEKAFKSSETEVRKQAFLCWKYLIDNFALNPEEFNIWKRVKLLVIPLNAKNSKIEVIALTKLEVWWHLIVTMFTTKTTDHLPQVIIQFLNFCFGPLGDTPLLSKKQNLMASPGKIFFKTKICAIDALLQMMVIKERDRVLITPVLKERLPTAIPIKMFEENHKSFLHSVSEAVIMMTNLTNEDLKNRQKLMTILWTNLTEYITHSNVEKKPNMYKELILVTNEMISHSDDSMITDLTLNNILPELVTMSDLLTYRDNTLIDLVKKVVTPAILERAQKKSIGDIRVLMERAVMPLNADAYHSHILILTKSLLERMSTALVKKIPQSNVIDLWCILADLLTRYMRDDQPINEGTDLSHNLTSMDTLVNFPFKHDIMYTKAQVKSVSVIWRHLYKAFDQRADRIPSVKHNLIMNTTAKVMVEALSRSDKCFVLLAHCLTPLMETVNYERLPTTGQVPALVYVLRDVLMLSIKNNCADEAELALQSLDAYLISVFGLNNGPRTLLYLEALRPAIEMLLLEKLPAGIEQDVLHTLEHIIFMIDKSAEALTVKFVGSFRQILLAARRHKDPTISSNMVKLIELNPNVKDDVRCFFTIMELDAANVSTECPEVSPLENKLVKPIKMVGSFLGKTLDSPKTLKTPEVKKESKRMTPLPPDPDSQDYVVITSEPKFDVNRFTEHQKECMKRRREDLAMFNDSSQSASTDTQDLEQWFEKSRMRNESNKENTITMADASSSSKKDDTRNVTVDSTNREIQLQKSPESVISAEDDVENSEASGSGVSQEIVKKLNFESREEFPESNDGTREKQPVHRDQGVFPHGGKSRRGRGGRSKRNHLEGYDTMDRHIKRKAGSDHDSDTSDRKRTKKSDDSDAESINSNESQLGTHQPRSMEPPGVARLSDHARREISRLKIDMVADFVFPTVSGRRRSKHKGDDTEDHPKARSLRSGDKEMVENEHSQELLKKRRKRSAKPDPEVIKKDTREQKMNNSADSNDKSDKSDKSVDPHQDEESTSKSEDMNSPDKPSAESSDHDEVVENSQEPTVLRSPKRLPSRTDTASPSTSGIVTKSPAPASPKVQKPEDPDETFIEEEKIEEKTSREEPKKIPEDSSKSPGLASFTSVLASSSPQNVQGRGIKISNRHGMSPHGRGAHMLGLISAASLNRDKSEEDKREPDPSQKTRPAMLRQTDRVSSPTGSRQEKIFNNMKGNELPAQSLFNTLRNDGEKISPKKDKAVELTPTDHDYAEPKIINNTTIGSERELPMLEWSSANPPSLTASPSFSILKRHKSLPLDTDPDITPKRKRVSFADPPVFKEMWYVPSTFKTTRTGSLRSTGRKDTPLKPKGRSRIAAVVDTSIEELESLTEVDRQRQKDNELLAKIADDLEEDDEVNFDSDDDGEDKGEIEDTTSLDMSKNDGEDLPQSDTTNNNWRALEKPILSVTDDSILNKIMSEGKTNKSQELEETLDIQNLSRFDSSAKPEELFVGKVPRTSTQLAAITVAAEADTLPITDSIFLSQTMSQCSQGSQNSINIPVAEQLDSISAIYPDLIHCKEPLSTIINDLTNPLWISHLTNWFKERGLKTIGDLATMTEKEVADIPTKGNPKAVYVKEILDKFTRNSISKDVQGLESTLSSIDDKYSGVEHMEIIEETIEVSNAERDDEDTLSATSEDTTTASISINSLDNSKGRLEIESVQTQDNDDSSIIISTSSFPPATISSGTETIGDDSMAISVDESQGPISQGTTQGIDVTLLELEGKNYKLVEVDREIVGHTLEPEQILGAALRTNDLERVLTKLQDRYGSDREFISKILASCKSRITGEDVREQLKEKCSSKEIYELTSEVLGNYKQKGENLGDVFGTLLQKIPKDCIGEALTDEKVVSSALLLDIALERNNPEVVANTVVTRFPGIVEKILETRGEDNTVAIISQSRRMSPAELRNVFRAISEQMEDEELLEVSFEVMRKRMKK
ncbi:telomere-associated protein RIF1 [Fopius arisanus]|uniref:Telomere-associated protein RIF1 n=2 Tax=Fopius arisanus TaxID=64838 RepID=A0A9R1TE51_9HYME|nr:PREDICTED: telomere-associated protein RIF1 [Fopius arisanus]